MAGAALAAQRTAVDVETRDLSRRRRHVALYIGVLAVQRPVLGHREGIGAIVVTGHPGVVVALSHP